MPHSNSHWRREAAPIIAKVIKETEGQDQKVIRAALRDAYPFGERAMHPYKIWTDEIRVQLGLKRKGRSCECGQLGYFQCCWVIPLVNRGGTDGLSKTTCGRWLCLKCATRVAANTDYCPPHFNLHLKLKKGSNAATNPA